MDAKPPASPIPPLSRNPKPWTSSICSPIEIDLERDLERGELIALLDRALALLPNDTRDILVAHYVEGLPNPDRRALGLTENAIAVRLHRGRRALRELLVTDLRQDIVEYGFAVSSADGECETRIWCPECGRSRLLARFEPAQGVLVLRCATCVDVIDSYLVQHRSNLGLFSDLKVYKPALNRVMEWAGGYYPADWRQELPAASRAASSRRSRLSGQPTPWTVPTISTECACSVPAGSRVTAPSRAWRSLHLRGGASGASIHASIRYRYAKPRSAGVPPPS